MDLINFLVGIICHLKNLFYHFRISKIRFIFTMLHNTIVKKNSFKLNTILIIHDLVYGICI